MTESGAPREWIWGIPFTKAEIRIIDFGRLELMCIPCTVQKSEDRMRKIYDAGGEYGYELGLRDAGRE